MEFRRFLHAIQPTTACVNERRTMPRYCHNRPRHDAERQNRIEPTELLQHTVRFGSKNAQRCRKMRPGTLAVGV